MTTPASRGVRIGELARRTGQSTHVLRAWEERYGLLRPARSAGGYRLYGQDDESRVRAVLALQAQGLSTGAAAAAVLESDRTAHGSGPSVAGRAPRPVLDDLREQLRRAMDDYDEEAAHAALDRVLTSTSLDNAVRHVVLPYLHELGQRWERGEVEVATEHFASSVIRRRLSVQALAWGVGTGPVAVLACPPGELHDIALLCFGLVLGRAGWRVRYLGQNTPVTSLISACQTIRPDLVVLAATRPEPYTDHLAGLRRLAASHPLALAGAGASASLAGALGAHHFPGDPVTAADQARTVLTTVARRRLALPTRAPRTAAHGPRPGPTPGPTPGPEE